MGDDRYEMYFYINEAVEVSKIDPPVILTDATLSSGNRHPFVCFADISPNRGITFQGGQEIEPSFRGDNFLTASRVRA